MDSTFPLAVLLLSTLLALETIGQTNNNPWSATSTTQWPSLNRKNNANANVTNGVPTWVRPTQPQAQFPALRKPSNFNNKDKVDSFINNERGQQNAWNKPLNFDSGTLRPIRLETTTIRRIANQAEENAQNAQNAKTNEQRLKEDNELREFSENVLSKDTNNAFRYVKVDYQGKTRSGSLKDEAPNYLLSIENEAYSIGTVQKLSALYNNYILNTDQNEVYTPQEKIEESEFLDAVLSTNVMQFTRNFLISKDKISKDPQKFKEVLRRIWFNMYSRGGGKIGSSGFEHVFLTEIKNTSISGLHNWLYFNQEELKNNANYLGYLKKLEFNKGAILKHHFNFQNLDKPVGTMFIGTSPEFELAIYSTCFLVRPNEICPLRLGGKNFIVRTYSFKYRGQNMIGSAFPEI